MKNIRRSHKIGNLVWIVKIIKSSLAWEAVIGKHVEITKNCIVEGIWDAPFSEENLEESNAFYGSGIIFRENSIIAVPSTALVDRIYMATTDNDIVLSNSLIHILRETESDIDENHDYRIEQDSILKGTKTYKKEFPIKSKKNYILQQIIHSPIKITNKTLEYLDRKSDPDFNNFSSYIKELESTIKRLIENAKSNDRRKPMKIASTISKGYDSTFVTSLLPANELEFCYTRKRSSSIFPSPFFKSHTNDDGTPIARIFNLSTRHLTDDHINDEELLFLASTPSDPETVFFDLYLDVKNSGHPFVIFTGYHGDKVWEKDLQPKYLSEEIIRGDTSGFGLSEPRVEAAFINAAIPFLYSDSIKRINNISNLHEQANWSIKGNYNRPIPRRYLEERKGIARKLFGQKKKAAIDYYNTPKNQNLKREFINHIKSNNGINNTRIFMERYIEIILLIKNKITNQNNRRNTLNLPYKMHIWAIKKLIKK